MKRASDLRIPFTWEDRHPIFLDRCLYIPGHYTQHEAWQKVPLFENGHPIVIEYCSGNGQWICDQAKKNPLLNWVAVEKRFDRARKIWAGVHRENLSNLLVICAEALIFTRHYVLPSSVSKMFVNFPDPWPKLRHAKHRLIRSEFLEEVEKILTPKSRAIFTTDDLPYAEEMKEVIAKHTAWSPLAIEGIEIGRSFFHDLWRRKGRAIHHLHYQVDL